MIAKFIVHHRLLIQRGITFVAIFVSTMTAVGVWRDSVPELHWGLLWGVGGVLYLALAWTIGYFDKKYLWEIETDQYSRLNPQLMEILTIVKQIKERQDNALQ